MIGHEELMALAAEARKCAYAPYSGFSVGAALLGASGRIYLGCNIENAAFTPTVCAERVAFFKAISEGERAFSAIAVTGGRVGEAPGRCAPCGVCRQVMAEFCRGELCVLLGAPGAVEETTLASLLPERFGPENLS